MKPALLFMFSAICMTAYSQDNNSKAPKDSASYVYRFQNKFFDITNLKFQDYIPNKNCIEIKKGDLYAPDFSGKSDSAVYKNRTYKLLENGDIVISKKGKHLKTIPNTDAKIPFDNVSGNSIIFSVPTGVIHILRLNGENGYHIKKYDAEGTLQKEWKIAHTLFKKTGNEIESIPYLYYRAHTNKEILFSSLDYIEPCATVILTMADGTQKKSDHSTAGMILDATNDSLVGTISDADSGRIFKVELNNKTWQIANTAYNNTVRTVLKDSVLVVAIYNNISTGCEVDAYNAHTGNLLWKGDVKQMMVAHSEYYNTVYLTLFRDKLILEGIEAYGSYLQVLDFKTGKRLFELMP
jgi:hypothetical protein